MLYGARFARPPRITKLRSPDFSPGQSVLQFPELPLQFAAALGVENMHILRWQVAVHHLFNPEGQEALAQIHRFFDHFNSILFNMAVTDTDPKPALEMIEHDNLKSTRPQNDPRSFGTRPPEWHTEFNKRLLRKVDFRMIPILCLMFLLNFLDRR